MDKKGNLQKESPRRKTTKNRCEVAFGAYLKKIYANGDMGYFLHAIQDWYTPKHAGNLLKGQKGHWKGDWFDFKGMWKALKDTVLYINETGACRW